MTSYASAMAPLTPMQRVYWKVPDGPMFTAEIPNETPYLALGSTCLVCPHDRINMIDRGLEPGYTCTAGAKRHSIPARYYRVVDGGRALDIYENGARLTRVQGELRLEKDQA